MTDAARKARNEYAKKWRKKNPDKVRASLARYWEKKAEQAETVTNQPTSQDDTSQDDTNQDDTSQDNTNQKQTN